MARYARSRVTLTLSEVDPTGVPLPTTSSLKACSSKAWDYFTRVPKMTSKLSTHLPLELSNRLDVDSPPLFYDKNARSILGLSTSTQSSISPQPTRHTFIPGAYPSDLAAPPVIDRSAQSLISRPHAHGSSWDIQITTLELAILLLCMLILVLLIVWLFIIGVELAIENLKSRLVAKRGEERRALLDEIKFGSVEEGRLPERSGYGYGYSGSFAANRAMKSRNGSKGRIDMENETGVNRAGTSCGTGSGKEDMHNIARRRSTLL